LGSSASIDRSDFATFCGRDQLGPGAGVKAVVHDRYGSPDVLRVEVNRPEFRAASFLVRKDAIMPKHYDAEVKARAVRLVAEHKVESGSVTKSCEAVGRRLGISKETLRGWCRQAQIDAGEREGVTSEELAEIKRLKAENRRLREDVEILRAATTFFAGELDPRNR
jgi:transposase